MEDDKMAASDPKPTKSLGIKQALKRLFRKSPNLSSDDGQWKRAASADQLAGASKQSEGGDLGGSDGRRHASSSHPDLKQTSRGGNISTGPSTSTTSQLDDMPPLEDTAANRASSLKAGKPKLVTKSAFQDNKENIPPTDVDDTTLASALEQIQLDDGIKSEEMQQQEAMIELDPALAAERAEHLRFIGEALDMARLALKINETPVGCVLVRNGQIIARGMNATNVTRNGTRHAELMAISSLLSCAPKDGQRTTRLKPKELSEKEAQDRKDEQEAILEDGESFVTMSDASSFNNVSLHEGNDDGSKSHLYPYGQKLLPEYRVDKSIITESILYVTVEPCIMCASLLKQLGIKKVYFGAVNDKFGGTGGVFSIHANSLPVSEDGQTASAHPMPRATQLPDGSGGHLGVSFPPGGGDGGNVEPGYEIEGGWGRDEAVGLLRRFYVQENGRAPVPRKKEGRAARLAAIENGEPGIDTGDEDGTGDATPNIDSEKEGSGETDM